MSGLLAFVSGMGKGLAESSRDFGNYLTTDMLQQKRNEMEMRRLELQEQYAVGREERTEKAAAGREERQAQHAEIMEEQREKGADRRQAELLKHEDTKLDKTQKHDTEEREKDREQHRLDQFQAKTIADRTASLQEDQNAITAEHYAATERVALATLKANRDKVTLMPMPDGTIMRINAEGKVLGKATDENGKPLVGEKTLAATTKLMVEVEKSIIQFKGEQLKNPNLLPDERKAITAEIDDLQRSIQVRLGMAQPKPTGGPGQLVDPDDPKGKVGAPQPGATPGPAGPNPAAMQHLEELRRQGDERKSALRLRTQQQVGEMTGEPVPPPVVPPPPPNTPPPGMRVKPSMETIDAPGQPAGLIPMTKPAKPEPVGTPPPREFPRAPEPAYLDQDTGGPPVPPPIDPMEAYSTTKPATLPREFERAKPQSLIDAGKPKAPTAAEEAKATKAMVADKAFEPYRHMVEEAAAEFGVPAADIYGIMKTETKGFDPRAVSKAGAKGLMQLMDGTAQDMGVQDVFDPRQNIRGGTKYYALLLRRYKGDRVKALQAYNAGMVRVDAGGTLPAETQAYVPKVDDYSSQF